MSFTVRNHYVPQWYQHRFLPPGQSKLWYLDLHPEKIQLPGNRVKYRDALRHLGPVNCFKQDHLYTLLFGNLASDVIEKEFFGLIDSDGEKAVQFFESYDMRDGVHEAFQSMLNYLAAQFFRTPKGLHFLQTFRRTPDHQQTLMAMRTNWQRYGTIWSEGVWEVFHCKGSPTKFLISDAPVTTYNPSVFPAAPEVARFGIAHFERIGTRTLFPIDANHCLCITNLQSVRNPGANPLKWRENPRYYGQGLFDLRKIQRGREVSESDVLAINHVLKTMARRYIGAAEKEWLYPEKKVEKRFWSKLGGPYFLQPDPRKVSFTTGIISGGGSGPSMGTNEYGHWQLDNQRAKALRDVEWKTFQKAKQAWDERDRRAGREPPKLSFDDL